MLARDLIAPHCFVNLELVMTGLFGYLKIISVATVFSVWESCGIDKGLLYLWKVETVSFVINYASGFFLPGKMQVLDFILAMTKATSDDKVRFSLHDLFNLTTFFNHKEPLYKEPTRRRPKI